MEYTTQLNKFLKDYEQLEAKTLQPTLVEIQNVLKDWEKSVYWTKYNTGNGVATPSPVRMIMTRIKQPKKAIDKIFRRPELFPDGLSISSIDKMYDVIGIRIIVYFSSQLSMIDRELRNCNRFILSEEAPPEAYFETETLRKLGLSHIENKHKESGYTSIHYAAKLADSSINNENKPIFEIQVRTLAQELWSELEHVLCYKPETRTHFSAKRRFQILSREVGVIDEHFNLLYEELIHNQEIASYQDEDTLTFENTPKVLNEMGIQCALTDLNPILKILFSRRIYSIKDLLDIASPRRLTTIRNTYIASTGRTPDNIELISAVVVLKGTTSKEAELERIKSQIDFKQSNKLLDKDETLNF